MVFYCSTKIFVFGFSVCPQPFWCSLAWCQFVFPYFSLRSACTKFVDCRPGCCRLTHQDLESFKDRPPTTYAVGPTTSPPSDCFHWSCNRSVDLQRWRPANRERGRFSSSTRLFRSFGLIAVSIVRIPPRWLCTSMPRDPTMTGPPKRDGANTLKSVLFPRSVGGCPAHATSAVQECHRSLLHIFLAICGPLQLYLQIDTAQAVSKCGPQTWETQTAECEGFQPLDLVTEAQPCDLDSNPNYGVNLQRWSCRVWMAHAMLSGLWSPLSPCVEEYNVLYNHEPPEKWWGWDFFEIGPIGPSFSVVKSWVLSCVIFTEHHRNTYYPLVN